MSRLVKIRLGDVPFWFLNDKIKLTSDNAESNYLDFDALNDFEQTILLNSVRYLEIRLFDLEGKRIKEMKELKNYTVAVEEIDEDGTSYEDFLPEINCITVSDCQEEENKSVLSEEDIENAKILLGNKLNTIKKTIEALDNSDKNALLIQAMLHVEEEEKNRKQIISCLETKLKEFLL
jgi:hypothetical protein